MSFLSSMMSIIFSLWQTIEFSFYSYLLFVFELWQMFQFAGSYFIWVCLFLELKPSGTIWLGSVLDKLPLVAKFVPDLFLSNVKRRRRLEQHKTFKPWSGFRKGKYQSDQVAKEKDLQRELKYQAITPHPPWFLSIPTPPTLPSNPPTQSTTCHLVSRLCR